MIDKLSLTLAIKTPQLIGIIAGCIVFAITISVTVYILFITGTLYRAFSNQALNDNQTKSPQLESSLPKLYEELLQASQNLPITPSVCFLEGQHIQLVEVTSDKLIDELSKASNGEAIFGESSYNPANIWGSIAGAFLIDSEKE